MNKIYGWTVIEGNASAVFNSDWIGLALWAGGMHRTGAFVSAGEEERKSQDADDWDFRRDSRWADVLEVA